MSEHVKKLDLLYHVLDTGNESLHVLERGSSYRVSLAMNDKDLNKMVENQIRRKRSLPTYEQRNP